MSANGTANGELSGGMVRVQVSVPPRLHAWLERDAHELGTSISTLARILLLDAYREPSSSSPARRSSAAAELAGRSGRNV